MDFVLFIFLFATPRALLIVGPQQIFVKLFFNEKMEPGRKPTFLEHLQRARLRPKCFPNYLHYLVFVKCFYVVYSYKNSTRTSRSGPHTQMSTEAKAKSINERRSQG